MGWKALNLFMILFQITVLLLLGTIVFIPNMFICLESPPHLEGGRVCLGDVAGLLAKLEAVWVLRPIVESRTLRHDVVPHVRLVFQIDFLLVYLTVSKT